MTVRLSCDHPRGAPAARRLRGRAGEFLAALAVPEAELSVALVTDRAIRALNRQWRGVDRATDVLSFPQSDPPGNGPLLGDVVISLDTAARRARAERRPVGAELDRYLAHGLLHLLGYDHERPEDARVMAEKEAELARWEGLVGAALRRGPRTPRKRSGWIRSPTSTSTRSPSGSTGAGTRATSSRGASRR
ncbi:MAG TPA: rRNA maturation RNase YbeY [Anaeromyxobacteraceae bacterium]|nr:rRNA maturation RNase YbeY [Anaeromyxobacteraceae bacterium]